MLGFYHYQGHGAGLLNIAFVIYVVALVTDFLDGYLARKWKVEGAFGRVVDPFVDKVLVIGTFIFFAGKNFVIPKDAVNPHIEDAITITGVAPWMVVVILARELLVTSFRGLSEGTGQNFGAAFSGKLKMGFQSGAILTILIYVNYLDALRAHCEPYATYFRNFAIGATIFMTIVSGLMYVQRAVAVYRKSLLMSKGAPASEPT